MLEESANGFDRIVSNQSQSTNQAYHYFLYNKARTVFKNKRFNEAIVEYDKSIAYKDDNVFYIDSLNDKAQDLFKMEKYDEALLIYNQLIENDTSNKQYYDSKGNIYSIKNKFELALKIIQESHFL